VCCVLSSSSYLLGALAPPPLAMPVPYASDTPARKHNNDASLRQVCTNSCRDVNLRRNISPFEINVGLYQRTRFRRRNTASRCSVSHRHEREDDDRARPGTDARSRRSVLHGRIPESAHEIRRLRRVRGRSERIPDTPAVVALVGALQQSELDPTRASLRRPILECARGRLGFARPRRLRSRRPRGDISNAE